jgi:hypothetical protein
MHREIFFCFCPSCRETSLFPAFTFPRAFRRVYLARVGTCWLDFLWKACLLESPERLRGDYGIIAGYTWLR